tara:strand:- start:4204 stop:4443 length:240 start_codon:yes stop_codon:yes gene_type:complete
VAAKCSKIDKICLFCSESTYNPETKEYDEKKRLFCGIAPPSWDSRVSSLLDCPKNMTISQLKAHQKRLNKSMPRKLRGW